MDEQFSVDRELELYSAVAEALRQLIAYMAAHGRTSHTALVLYHVTDEEIARIQRDNT